jgi:hypothetical protein
MAAKIEWQRHKHKTASIYHLLAHEQYLNDPTDPDHKGYTMMGGRNYHCPGDTIDDLVAAINLADANYFRRKTILKHRHRSKQLWGEAIFCLGKDTHITAEEREKIEQEYIRRFFPDAACRAHWHVNDETGSSDLHIIFAHKRPCGVITIVHKETGTLKRMQALDRFAADLLNSNPDKPALRIPDIQTSEDTAEAHAQYYSELREEKEAALADQNQNKSAEKTAKKAAAIKRPRLSRALHAQVARQAEIEGIEDVEKKHLRRLLESIGIKVLEVLHNIIKYESSRKTRKGKTAKGEVRKPRTGIIRIHDFLYDVLHAQVDIRIAREREMSELTEAQPETPVEISVVAPVEKSATPVTQSVAKKTSGKTPEDKAALLQAFLNAALGRTKVKAKKLKSLAEATKGMLTPSGKIAPHLLETLTDDQKAVLIPLAAEYTEHIG